MSATQAPLSTELTGGRRIVPLDGDRAHYLRNVLRLREGAEVRLFNAADGEWSGAHRRGRAARVEISGRGAPAPAGAGAGPCRWCSRRSAAIGWTG